MDGLLHIKGIKLKNAGQEMILGAELLRVGFPTNDGVTVEEHFDIVKNLQCILSKRENS